MTVIVRSTAVAESSPEPTEIDQSRRVALGVAEALADTPAADTVVLDIRELSSFADYFVICSGENERQLRAIQTTTLQRLQEDGVRPHRVEGTAGSGWILIDFGDVIVHVFEATQRAFYRLESLWSEAPTLLTIE